MDRGVVVQSSASPSLELSLSRSPAHADHLAPVALTEARTRNEAIDILRLVAALSIVFVHAAEAPRLEGFKNFWRFPVPFFLFASLYFQMLSFRTHPDRPTFAYIGRRFSRLYLPFLAWCVIYTVARNVKRVSMINLSPIDLHPSLLWKGTEYHLWFLPFLLLSSMALVAITAPVLRFDRRLRWPLIVLFVAAGIAFAILPMPSSWDELFDNPTYAYVQWWRALPAACGAIAFCLFMAAGEKNYKITKPVAIAGMLLAITCGIIQAIHGPQMIARMFTGLGCILLALAPWDTSTAVRAGLARLGRYGYGIYLNHVFCVELIHSLSRKLDIPPSIGLDLLNFFLSITVSMLIAWRLSKIKKLAWLNG